MKYPDARLDVFNVAGGGYAGYNWTTVQNYINAGNKLKDIAALADPTGLVLSYRIIKTALELGYLNKVEIYSGTKYPLGS